MFTVLSTFTLEIYDLSRSKKLWRKNKQEEKTRSSSETKTTSGANCVCCSAPELYGLYSHGVKRSEPGTFLVPGSTEQCKCEHPLSVFVVVQFHYLGTIHPSHHPSSVTNLLFTTCPPSEPWDITWEWIYRQPFSLPVTSDVCPPWCHGNRRNTSHTHTPKTPCIDAPGSEDKQPRPADGGAPPMAAKRASKKIRVDARLALHSTEHNEVTWHSKPTSPPHCRPSASTLCWTTHSPANP